MSSYEISVYERMNLGMGAKKERVYNVFYDIKSYKRERERKEVVII